MKKSLENIFYGKSSTGNGTLALLLIAMFALGCFCNKEKLADLGLKDSDSPTPTTSPADSATPSYKKADASKYEIPSDDELQDIVKTTMLDFDNALKKADFKDFHSKISKYWQKQISPEKMKESFQGFIDGQADLSEIKSLKANFTSPPNIKRQGSLRILEVKGDYDTTPNKSTFELQYIPEGKEWKLFGINVVTTIRKNY